jgi:ABC-2 type transport system ATP-binding protein
MSNSGLAIEVHNLKKRFGSFELNIPKLCLERGVVLGLVGQNGAGKSTLINLLINLIYPDNGEICLLGMRQPQDELPIKRLLGYVSENPLFYEEMTVGLLARVVSSFYPDWDNAIYRKYLKAFDLSPKKRVRQLSKGMKVKLAITLALSHQPQLLILDEPTSGIDPVMRKELLQEILKVIQDEQRTVLFSSHITQDVEQIADYVAILEAGQMVEFDDRESLLGRWQQLTCRLQGARPGWERLFVRYRSNADSVFGIVNSYGHDWQQAAQQAGLVETQIQPCSLETILLTLAGKEVINHVGAHL